MRQFTVGQLAIKARERADMVNSGFIATDELNSYISQSYTKLYNLLVKKGLHFFEAEQTITTDGTSQRINLPADYYGTLGVDYQVTTDEFIELPEFMVTERNAFQRTSSGRAQGYRIVGDQIELAPIPPANQTYRHLYVPAPARLGVGLVAAQGTITDALVVPSVADTLTIGDGVNTFVFEFSSNTFTIAAGNYFIEIGSTTADQITKIIAAINDSGLRIDAVTGITSIDAALTNQDGGTHGNVTITTTAGALGVTGMVAGAGVGIMDGVSGWEEYIVLDTAIKMLNKEETSAVPLEREREAMEAMIEADAENRAMTQPRRVVDIDRMRLFSLFEDIHRDRFGVP